MAGWDVPCGLRGIVVLARGEVTTAEIGKLPISAMDDDDDEEGAHSSYGGVRCQLERQTRRRACR